ncbi:hypothetical protein E9840_11755 [Tissierella creatinini]|nr:hypothetical protein E9840_11755 [Tissierella creatinini]TJX60085.1 hypothetical protein E8P77_20595 [Soehngenia saccharolytica]
MKEETAKSIPIFLLRVIVIHFLTYYFFGMLASRVLHYETILSLPVIRDYMLGYGDASVVWGPLIQPARGLILGCVLLPFRNFLAEKKYGWIYLWLVFVGIGILSPPAAAPCSIEGMIYTRLPFWYHLIGLPEILLQTLVFSILVHLYMRYPAKVLKSLPPVIGILLQSIAVACFAFIGYAVFSVLYALKAGVEINAEANLSLKVQGLFIAPFVLNFAAIAFLNMSKRIRGISRISLFFIIWFCNAVLIAVYQELLMGGANPLFVIVAPVLPSMIVAVTASKKFVT